MEFKLQSIVEVQPAAPKVDFKPRGLAVPVPVPGHKPASVRLNTSASPHRLLGPSDQGGLAHEAIYTRVEVGPGQNLEKVVADYNARTKQSGAALTTVYKVAAASNLKNFHVSPGQPLVVPGPGLLGDPDFKKSAQYYKEQYTVFENRVEVDRSLNPATRPQISVHASGANYSMSWSKEGAVLKSTHIDVNERKAALRQDLTRQRNEEWAQELVPPSESKVERLINVVNKVDGQGLSLAEGQIHLDPAQNKARTQAIAEHNRTTSVARRKPTEQTVKNLANRVSDQGLKPVAQQIHLDAQKAAQEQADVDVYVREVFSKGRNELSLTENRWVAAFEGHAAGFYDVLGHTAQALGAHDTAQWAQGKRVHKSHQAELALERARAQGAIEHTDQIESWSDYGNWIAGLGIQTVPYLMDMAAGAATGGVALGARFGVNAARAGGFAASYPSSVGAIYSAQRDQNGTTHSGAAFGLGALHAAANLFGFEGQIISGNFFKSTSLALNRMQGVKGGLARSAHTGVKMGPVEGGTEAFQFQMETLGQMAVDPGRNYWTEDTADGTWQSFLAGTAIGSKAGSAFGWRRGRVAEERVYGYADTWTAYGHEYEAEYGSFLDGYSNALTRSAQENNPYPMAFSKASPPKPISARHERAVNWTMAAPVKKEGAANAESTQLWNMLLGTSSPITPPVSAKPPKKSGRSQTLSGPDASTVTQRLLHVITHTHAKRLLEVADFLEGVPPGQIVQNHQASTRKSVHLNVSNTVKHLSGAATKPKLKDIASILEAQLTPLLQPGQTTQQLLRHIAANPGQWAIDQGLIQATDPQQIRALETDKLIFLDALIKNNFDAKATIRALRPNASSNVVRWAVLQLQRALNPTVDAPRMLAYAYPGGLDAFANDIRDELASRPPQSQQAARTQEPIKRPAIDTSTVGYRLLLVIANYDRRRLLEVADHLDGVPLDQIVKKHGASLRGTITGNLGNVAQQLSGVSSRPKIASIAPLIHTHLEPLLEPGQTAQQWLRTVAQDPGRWAIDQGFMDATDPERVRALPTDELLLIEALIKNNFEIGTTSHQLYPQIHWNIARERANKLRRILNATAPTMRLLSYAYPGGVDALALAVRNELTLRASEDTKTSLTGRMLYRSDLWVASAQAGVEYLATKEVQPVTGGHQTWQRAGTDSHVAARVVPADLRFATHTHLHGPSDAQARTASELDHTGIDQNINAHRATPLVSSVQFGPRGHHVHFYGVSESKLSRNARLVNLLEDTRRTISEAVAATKEAAVFSLPARTSLKYVGNTAVLRLDNLPQDQLPQVIASAIRVVKLNEHVHTLRVEHAQATPDALRAAVPVDLQPHTRTSLEDYYDIDQGAYDLMRTVSVASMSLTQSLAEFERHAHQLSGADRAYAFQSLMLADTLSGSAPPRAANRHAFLADVAHTNTPLESQSTAIAAQPTDWVLNSDAREKRALNAGELERAEFQRILARQSAPDREALLTFLEQVRMQKEQGRLPWSAGSIVYSQLVLERAAIDRIALRLEANPQTLANRLASVFETGTEGNGLDQAIQYLSSIQPARVTSEEPVHLPDSQTLSQALYQWLLEQKTDVLRQARSVLAADFGRTPWTESLTTMAHAHGIHAHQLIENMRDLLHALNPHAETQADIVWLQSRLEALFLRLAKPTESAHKTIQRLLSNPRGWVIRNGWAPALTPAVIAKALSLEQLQRLERYAQNQWHEIGTTPGAVAAGRQLLSQLGLTDWAQMRLLFPAGRMDLKKIVLNKTEAQRKFQLRRHEQTLRAQESARRAQEKAAEKAAEQAKKEAEKEQRVTEREAMRLAIQLERRWQVEQAMAEKKRARALEIKQQRAQRQEAIHAATMHRQQAHAAAVTGYLNELAHGVEQLKRTQLYPLSRSQGLALIDWITEVLRAHGGNPHQAAPHTSVAHSAVHSQIRQTLGIPSLMNPMLTESIEGVQVPPQLISALVDLRLNLNRQIQRHPPSQYGVMSRLRATWASVSAGQGLVHQGDHRQVSLSYDDLAHLPELQPLSAYPLSADEVTLLQYLSKGATLQAMAQTLRVSMAKVRALESSVRAKLGLQHPDTAGELLARYPKVPHTVITDQGQPYQVHDYRWWFDLAHWQPGYVARYGKPGVRVPAVPPIEAKRLLKLNEVLGARSATQWLQGTAPATDAIEYRQWAQDLQNIAEYEQNISDFLGLDALTPEKIRSLTPQQTNLLARALTHTLDSKADSETLEPVDARLIERTEATLGVPDHFFAALPFLSQGIAAQILFDVNGPGRTVRQRLQSVHAQLLAGGVATNGHAQDARVLKERALFEQRISHAVARTRATHISGLSQLAQTKVIQGTAVLRIASADGAQQQQAIATALAWAEHQPELHTLRVELANVTGTVPDAFVPANRTYITAREKFYDLNNGRYGVDQWMSVTGIALEPISKIRAPHPHTLQDTDRAYALLLLSYLPSASHTDWLQRFSQQTPSARAQAPNPMGSEAPAIDKASSIWHARTQNKNHLSLAALAQDPTALKQALRPLSLNDKYFLLARLQNPELDLSAVAQSLDWPLHVVQTYETVVPMVLGVKELPTTAWAPDEPLAQLIKKLKRSIQQNEFDRTRNAKRQNDSGTAHRARSLATESIDPARLEQFFLNLPHHYIQTYWMQAQGGFPLREITLLTGITTDTALDRARSFLKISRADFIPYLRAYLGPEQTPETFLWQLVTRRHEWAQQKFGLIDLERINAAASEMTPQYRKFLRAKSLFGNDAAAIQTHMGFTAFDTVSEYGTRIYPLFGATSWEALDWRVALPEDPDQPRRSGDGIRALSNALPPDTDNAHGR